MLSVCRIYILYTSANNLNFLKANFFFIIPKNKRTMTDSFTLTSCLTNDGRYKCPHCPADFAGSSGLWYHFKHNHTGQRVHDGRRQYKSDPSEPRHKCELCDATFAGISGLWYHMKHSHKSAPKNLHSVKTETRMPRKSVRVGVGSLEGANLNQVIERYSRLLKNRQHE